MFWACPDVFLCVCLRRIAREEKDELEAGRRAVAALRERDR